MGKSQRQHVIWLSFEELLFRLQLGVPLSINDKGAW